jgi:hypothetical protein
MPGDMGYCCRSAVGFVLVPGGDLERGGLLGGVNLLPDPGSGPSWLSDLE